MSDGFPSGSCAGAILSHGEVFEIAGRFLPVPLVFYRGCKTGEFRTRSALESRALWIMMMMEQSIVAQGPDRERPA